MKQNSRTAPSLCAGGYFLGKVEFGLHVSEPHHSNLEVTARLFAVHLWQIFTLDFSLCDHFLVKQLRGNVLLHA